MHSKCRKQGHFACAFQGLQTLLFPQWWFGFCIEIRWWGSSRRRAGLREPGPHQCGTLLFIDFIFLGLAKLCSYVVCVLTSCLVPASYNAGPITSPSPTTARWRSFTRERWSFTGCVYFIIIVFGVYQWTKNRLRVVRRTPLSLGTSYVDTDDLSICTYLPIAIFGFRYLIIIIKMQYDRAKRWNQCPSTLLLNFCCRSGC